jgi:hypothetical protein
VHTASLYDVPTRGSLARDDSWVAGVAALDWGADEAGPDGLSVTIPGADRHVVFAGEVPGGRTALVLGRTGRVLFAMWFTGPKGAHPAQMAPANKPYTVYDGYPQALWDVPSTGEGVLVAIGQPEDSLTYMTGMDISEDGHFREVWQPLPTENGVAVTTMPWGPTGYGSARVRAGSDPPALATPTDRAIERQPVPIEPDDPRSLLDRQPRDQIAFAVGTLAAYLGTPSGRLDPVLLWAGRNAEDSPHSTLLMGVTLPSGATAVCAVGYRPFAGGSGGYINYMVVAAPAGPGTALLDRTIAVPTLDGMVVVGPRSGVRAEVLENNEVITTFPLDEGGGVVRLPEGTYPDTVRVFDAAGNVVGETTARPETMD